MKNQFLIIFSLCLFSFSCKDNRITFCKDAIPDEYTSSKEFEHSIIDDFKTNLVLNRYGEKIDSIFETGGDLSKQGYVLTKKQMINIAKKYIQFNQIPSLTNSDSLLANVCLSIPEGTISYKKLDRVFSPKKIRTYIPISMSSSIISAKKAAIDELIYTFPSLKNKDKSGLHLLFHNSKLTINHVMENNNSLGALFEGEVYPIVIEALESGKYKSPDGNTISAGLLGKDKHGKTAIFQVIVLNEKYNWEFAETSKIESLNTGLQANILAPIQSPTLISNLENLLDLIAIGTASCEGNIDREFERSRHRANVMAELLDDSYSSELEIPIQTLALGKFIGDCHNNTAYQRKIVLVGTTFKEANVDVEEALKDVLQSPRSPLQIDKYSHFLLESFNTNPTILTAYSH